MNFFKRLIRFFATGSEYSDRLDYNHLADHRLRRRFTSPTSHASQLFSIINQTRGFGRIIQRLGNEHTLLRFAVIGQEIRVLGYRAATDLLPGEAVYPVFDPYWNTDGIFHYLVSGNKVELLIRERPAMHYDAYEPVISMTIPLTADEVELFHPNWLPVQS